MLLTKTSLQAVLDGAKWLCIDFETDGLHPITNKIVGMSILSNKGGGYIPLAPYRKEENAVPWDGENPEEIGAMLGSHLQFSSIPVIGHNIKFDLHCLTRLTRGIVPTNIVDTQVGMWLLAEENELGLKGILNGLFDADFADYGDLINKTTAFLHEEIRGAREAYVLLAPPRKKGMWGKQSIESIPMRKAQSSDVPIEWIAPYAYRDVVGTAFLWFRVVRPLLQKEELLAYFYSYEMPFLRVLFDMEQRGIRVDIGRLKEMEKELSHSLVIIQREAESVVGKPINLSSTPELREILFSQMGYTPSGRLTDKGSHSLDEKALKQLLLSYPDALIFQVLQRHRETKKRLSNYAIGLQEAAINGRIHTTYNQTGCVVGSTMILSERGMYSIQDACTEKELCVVNGGGNTEQPSHCFNFKAQPTIRIITELGMELEGTHDHPIIVNYFTKRGRSVSSTIRREFNSTFGWKRLQDIRVGDAVAVQYGQNMFGSTYFDLNTENCVPSTNTNSKKNVKFPTVVSEDLAEFLGMYFADGSIHANNGSWSIRISNRNNNVRERVHALSVGLFGVDTTYDEAGTTYITSISLSSYFEGTLGLANGCKNKIIPDYILRSPRSVVAAFIRGMTLDSCVVCGPKKTYMKFTIANEYAAYQLQQILLNMGIMSSKRKEEEHCFNVVLYNAEYIKFKSLIGFIENEKYIDHTHAGGSNNYLRIDEDNRLWLTVREIQYGCQDVYDFTMPLTHSFISGGFVSHNTVTGRLSSSEPNLQNQEKGGQVRKVFVASPGMVLVKADYGQAELRVLADRTEDPILLDVYETGKDIHAETQHRLNLPDRRMAKVINFLLVYGGGPSTYYENLFFDYGVRNYSVEKCSEDIKNFYVTYKAINPWKKKAIDTGKRQGFVKSRFGRHRHLPLLNAADMVSRSYAERQCVNTLIQGDVADIVKAAMILAAPIAREYGGHLLLQVHDELVFEIPRSEAESFAFDIKGEMENVVKLLVPVVVDVEMGDNWGECS